MAEYSLYFGTHSAHKANAWTLRLWLNQEFAFLKQKDYKDHSFTKQKVGIMNRCEQQP